MEITFEEVRTGIETQRPWSDLAVARTTPVLLIHNLPLTRAMATLESRSVQAVAEGAFMPIREIDSVEELRSFVGREFAVGDWFEITQGRINLFADATRDHQWIHSDIGRAQKESLYGGTIAHGFLTLSLLSHLMSQMVAIKLPIKMSINYGLNKVRFPTAVPSGAKIRARAMLQSFETIFGGLQLVWNITVEREGSEKPCCAAEWLVRYYFE